MSSSTELLSLLNGWDVPHTDRQISPAPGTVRLSDLHLALPYDINSFAFSKYCRQYIRDRNLGYLSSPIRLPFLPKQTAIDNKQSVDIFQMILQYISEESGLTDEKRRLLGSFIIQKGLTSWNLRDEIYIQLCNQTMGDHKKYDQQIQRAWNLLALCLSTFPPSKDLSKYLLKYVSDSKSTAEYNVVCQQKLLQCIDIEPKLSRIYPPTLLEWESAKRKACMALTTSFPDGEKVLGHVESWTTGESFAAHSLRTRGYGNALSGWSVTMRDDGDLYECAGYDYVMDFVGEIEVPPLFPCSSAYYLTTCGVAKSNKQHYNDQPHTADRPRLMPLDVAEHPESLISADIRSTRPPLSIPPPRPRTPTPPPTPIVSTPTVASPVQSPRPKPPTPQPLLPAKVEPPVKKVDNIYAANNDAMSQGSALNRRKDVLAENLSTTSALNNRYSQLSGGAPAPKQPPIYERPRQLSPVIVRPKPEPQRNAISFRQPRHEKPPISKDPLRFRDAVEANKSESENLGFMVDSLFENLDDLIDDDVNNMADPVRMKDMIKGGGDDGHKQSSNDLEVQLKTKQLEVEVLQKSIQVEKIKQELDQLKQATHTSEVTPVNGTQLTDGKKQPPQTKPKTTAAAAAPVVTGRKVSVGAQSSVTGTHNGIPFAATNSAIQPESTTSVAALYSIPPPPPPLPLTSVNDVSNKSGQTGEKIQNGIDTKEAQQSKGDVVKATPAGGTYKNTPRKIGQIRWPPSSDKEEVETPKPTPGKLVIDEQIEESIIIGPKQSPETIRRKVEEKIKAARLQREQQDALRLAEESRKELRKFKPPVAVATAATVSAVAVADRTQDSSDESEYDDTISENTGIDMNARKMTLEQKLIDAEWGSVRRTRPQSIVPPRPPSQNIPEPPPIIEPPVDVSKLEVEKVFDIHSMDNTHTVLYAQIAEPFLTYTKVPWTFEVRKEVFSPMEQLENPNIIQLIFAQIVHDVFTNESIRLGKDDRSKITKILDTNSIHMRNVSSQNHRLEVKLSVINVAKETPFYFSRFYPVNGGSRLVNLHLLGVSHSGVRLITRFKDFHDDYLSSIEHIQFDEILEITVAKQSTVLIRLARKSIVVYSYMASNIVSFIKSYKDEAEKLKWQQHK